MDGCKSAELRLSRISLGAPRRSSRFIGGEIPTIDGVFLRLRRSIAEVEAVNGDRHAREDPSLESSNQSCFACVSVRVSRLFWVKPLYLLMLARL